MPVCHWTDTELRKNNMVHGTEGAGGGPRGEGGGLLATVKTNYYIFFVCFCFVGKECRQISKTHKTTPNMFIQIHRPVFNSFFLFCFALLCFGGGGCSGYLA